MLLNSLMERFAGQAPMCVATRVLLEAALDPQALDTLFANVSQKQYQRELLFSTCVELMGLVVSRTHRSLNAAYQASPVEVGVSLRAVYDKVAGIEPQTSAEFVRHTARRLAPVIEQMQGQQPALLPGWKVRILDGNHLGKSQRRLKLLRNVAAGPLPGQTLVVLDPELGLVTDIACCENGHAQERSFTGELLEQVTEGEVWIADRNFCTTNILFDIAARSGRFLIRQHASTLKILEAGPSRAVGRCPTGKLSEQTLKLAGPQNETLVVRRITIHLDEPTRDGETEIHLLTTLTSKEASARKLALLYRTRWKIETMFQTLTSVLKCEVNTLGYPPAALFGFCVAVAAYNIHATIKGALSAVHGAAKVAAEVSDYFLADEIAGAYRGMMIAIPEPSWRHFGKADTATLAEVLLDLARQAKLQRYKKSPRGEKKPKPRRTRFAKSKHIATSKLLDAEKQRK